MVVVGRFHWVRRRILQGACIHITFGSASLQGRSTVKATVLMAEVMVLLTRGPMFLVMAQAGAASHGGWPLSLYVNRFCVVVMGECIGQVERISGVTETEAQDSLEAAIGKEDASEKAFWDLCFEFGLELDDVTSDYEIACRERGK
ncbi:unnamed protein product, partial [Prorocentrum cordatum]